MPRQRRHLGGREANRADRGATAPIDEVVRPTSASASLAWIRNRFSTGSGSGAVAILGGGAQLTELVVVLRQRDAAMEVDLERLGLDVRRGHVCVDASVDAHRLHGDARLVRELGDRLVQHLDVELAAERRDVTGLLRAQEVAGAADLEVAHRDLEACSITGMVGQGGETLAPRPSSLEPGYRRYAWAVTSERPTRPRIW